MAHAQLRAALEGAATRGKLVVLERVFHSFDGQGVAGMLLLSSSHLTVHTWPEFGYAAVDLFTCDPIPAEGQTEADLVRCARRRCLDAESYPPLLC